MLRVYAPASSANISVGFDTLGAAISPINGSLLGDVVQIEPIAAGFELESAGYFVRKLPKEPQKNIVYQAYVLFSEQLKLRNAKVKPLRLTLEKNMPIGSGLGSSACSIVAALVALNKFHDEPFSKMELLEMMGELEGRISGSIHYDATWVACSLWCNHSATFAKPCRFLIIGIGSWRIRGLRCPPLKPEQFYRKVIHVKMLLHMVVIWVVSCMLATHNRKI